jgi:hypothetical protein
MTLPWTLEEALRISRKIAPVVRGCGLEVVLRVSPLFIGHNSDDLDLLLLVEEPGICSPERCLKELKDHLPEVRAIGALQSVASESNASIWLHNGRHLEMRFVLF